MLRVLASTALLLLVAMAHATVTAGHCLWDSGTLPDSGKEFFSFRLFVEVTDTPGGGSDDWTAAGLEVDLTGGVFYQHTSGANPPSVPWFPTFPDLEYDTYYTSPADYPNTDYSGAIVGVASSVDTDTRLDTDWFDTHETGNGEFVIAQITVMPSEPDWIATGLLQYAAADTGGQLFDYAFTIPEPGALVLLMLGGLAVIRRRG